MDQTWPKNGGHPSSLEAPSTEMEILFDKIQELSPKDENQRSLKAQALSVGWDIVQTRWLQYAQQASSISTPFMVTLGFWFTAIFISYGLFAPRNATVIVCMFVSAASVSAAILMILEMYRPYAGLIRLSSAPVRAALAQLGK
jgi:hypothetical protein